MKFIKLKIQGAYIIKLNSKIDLRGSFTRLFCSKILKKRKIKTSIKQINIAYNKVKGSVRGFHYQVGRYSEIKRITVLQGKIYDIIIDIRKKSKTFGQKLELELDSKIPKILIIPNGVAHGYQSLTRNTKVVYFNSNFYNKKYERGILYKSKKFNISWPLKPKKISKKDRRLKDF